MKKIMSIIAIALVVALVIPSVPAYAFNNTFVQYLAGSQDYYTGRLYTVANNVLYTSMPNSNSDGLSSSNYETVNTYLTSNYSGSELLIFGGNLLSTVSSSINLHYFNGVTNGRIFNFGTNSSGVTYASGWVLVSDTPFTFGLKYNVNGGSNISRGDVAYSDRQSVAVTVEGVTYYCCANADIFSSNTDTTITVTPGDSSYGLCLNGNIQSLSYCSVPIYTVYEDDSIANNAQYSRISQLKFIFGDYDLTPLNGQVNAYTSEGVESDYNTGVLPDPEPVVENNSNHMYFNSCDFGFCEPKGISNYNQFGGAYIYCRYVVDDWVVNHISDYSLQISMETLLDNQRYFRTLNYPLDRDGCLTLPFKNFGLTGADDITQGFVVVGNSNQTIDLDYFKVNLYSITTEQSKQEWFENAARTYNTVKAIDIYDTYDFTDVQDFYESNVAKYNKFTINLRAVLVSGEDNSGPVARSFNLVTGSDIATDTSGYDNENPFVPDDSTEDYTPSLPSDNNTTVPSIVINTGGTWQGTFNGKIGFDPGYSDLKLDVNKDPDGNFTQYLNPMKNQTFGSWFFSFLDDMPGEMKALLIAGTGVGIFFGLYRFIRRG